MDLIEIRLACGKKVGALNIIDSHTGFQVVWPIQGKRANQITSNDVLLHYEMAWSHWANLSQRFGTDPGSEFRGVFEGFCASIGRPLNKSGTEEHWAMGQVEVAGRVWKTAFKKTAAQHHLCEKEWA